MLVIKCYICGFEMKIGQLMLNFNFRFSVDN